MFLILKWVVGEKGEEGSYLVKKNHEQEIMKNKKIMNKKKKKS